MGTCECQSRSGHFGENQETKQDPWAQSVDSSQY